MNSLDRPQRLYNPAPMAARDLPSRIRTRADVDALLALTTNYEERLPRDPSKRMFKLERVTALLAAVGDPQGSARTVHIAGSKGKGSVARMIAHVLQACGAGPVGLFTSPHLEDLSERIAVDGVPVDEAAMARAADQLLPYLREERDTSNAPTFFEILTAMAWLVFRDVGCTDVVLETGLGGRLDATNVCTPAVTVITTIELEHTRLLGDTIEEIAAEKAGILKKNVPAITTATGAALDVITRHAQDVGAPLTAVGREVQLTDAVAAPGPQLTVTLHSDDETHALHLPIAGVHHAENTAAAFLALEALEIAPIDIEAALRTVRLPGVVEPIAESPVVIVDGAHTARSAETTDAAVSACWPDRPRVLLIAMLDDKDAAAVGAPLASSALHVIATEVGSRRTMRADALAEALGSSTDPSVEAVADTARALDIARARAKEFDGLVLASGSVYLAGAVKTLLR